MSMHDLLNAYAGSVDEQHAIERAIQVELPGGPEALEARTQLDRLRRKSPGPDPVIAVQLVDDIIEAMTAEIGIRYSLENSYDSP